MKLIYSISQIFFVCFILMQPIMKPVAALCCGCPTEYNRCDDGTRCDFSCCSYKSCNIFCCRCDDRCRTRSGANHLFHDTSYEQDFLNEVSNEESMEECMDRFDAVDMNHDGSISFLEWANSHDAFGHLELRALAERWNQYDWEGKGYLTMEEAVHRKAPGLLSSKEDLAAAQKPLKSLTKTEQSTSSIDATRTGWYFNWYSDGDCKFGGRNTFAMKSQPCANIKSSRGIKFYPTGTGTSTLSIYPEKGCGGVQETFNTTVECTEIDFEVLSYSVEVVE